MTLSGSTGAVLISINKVSPMPLTRKTSVPPRQGCLNIHIHFYIFRKKVREKLLNTYNN